MNALHHLLPRWTHRPGTGRGEAWGPFGASSRAHSRIEVCPPALWPSSLTFWGRARRWLERSPWMPDQQRPVNRLAVVKREFHAGLDGLGGEAAASLADRIERARSLRELWHLRSALYNLLATGFSQVEAELRLGPLNRHFPTRGPRAGWFAGHPPH